MTDANLLQYFANVTLPKYYYVATELAKYGKLNMNQNYVKKLQLFSKNEIQEAQLSLTNCATLFCKVVEVLQDFLSENVDKKFITDYNVA